MDVLFHGSSAALFYPFSQFKLGIGIAWWKCPGIYLWLILWAAFIVLLVLIRKKNAGIVSL